MQTVKNRTDFPEFRKSPRIVEIQLLNFGSEQIYLVIEKLFSPVIRNFTGINFRISSKHMMKRKPIYADKRHVIEVDLVSFDDVTAEREFFKKLYSIVIVAIEYLRAHECDDAIWVSCPNILFFELIDI